MYKQRAATKMLSRSRELPFELQRRLQGLKLPTLKKWRERKDLAVQFKRIQRWEKVDRDNLLVKDDGKIRGHEYEIKKIKKVWLFGIKKKYTSLHRNIDI